MNPAGHFNSIEQAIRDIKRGHFVILVDDEDRENEGDLVMAAEKVTPQAVNFMAKHGRYFPPGIENTDQLIEHLHRQASQMASLLNSMSPEMREELRSLMDIRRA